MDELCELFGLNEYNLFLDYNNNPFKQYWIAPWYCTDTYVGHSALYVHDTFVAIMTQQSRKDNREFYWVGKEEIKLTKTTLLQYYKEHDNFLVSSFARELAIMLDDHDYDGKEGYSLYFNEQLLCDKIIYDNNVYTVINKITHEPGIDDEIQITQDNMEILTVKLKDCLVPYNIKA